MAKAFGGLGTTAGLAADRTSMSGMSAGQGFFETDTNKAFIYSGSSWVEVNDLDNVGGVSDAAKKGLVPPACYAYRSTDTAISYNTGIPWSTTIFNTDNMWSSGANININTAGIYSISFSGLIVSGSSWQYADVAIAKNNSRVIYHYTTDGGTALRFSVSGILNCTVGETIQGMIDGNGGSPVATGSASEGINRTRLVVVWLGAY